MCSNLSRLGIAAFASATLLCATPSHAEVFHSRQGALKLAFPQADAVKRKHVFLREAQRQQIAELSGARLEAKLLTVYAGYKNGRLLGHAFIDTHTVRTLPETFMVVISAAGEVTRVQILAFHEPREYLPPPKWLEQFHRRRYDSARSGIAGIAGSTLSAHAITRATRKILAIHKVIGLGGSQTRQAGAPKKTAMVAQVR